MALPIPHKLFTIDDYDRIIDSGILKEDDRVELLSGEIVEMAPIGLRHAVCVARIEDLLHEQTRRRAIVWVQNPIWLPGDSVPQPDLALLKQRADFYLEHRPTPEDVLLLIEVADTSLFSDRIAKVPIYAQAGINRLWLVNLVENVIEVYTDPVGSSYSSWEKLGPGSDILLPLDPAVALPVVDILG
ncbi:MAG: Uma2 family endonuclease [Chloroflexota bacterium]|nr:Uma2 family endonuclease [Chloroflexota bacterium]